MKVAFLGLGRMGAPMARRVAGEGHELVVWNRTRSRAEGFDPVAASPVEAAMGAQVVITMLSGPEALREVVFASGMSRSLRPDAVYVDMSTAGVQAARRIHDSVERASVDAPVGGGVAQAESGDLIVLAGGEDAAIDRALPVLRCFGEVVRCGGPSSGQAMKLAFNSVLASAMSAVGEAVSLGEKLGLDTELVLDVLGRGGAGPLVARKASRIAEGSYPASFALSLMRKDIGLVQEAAGDAGAFMPVAGLVQDLLERAEREGLGEDDYSAITELFRRS